MQLHDIVTVDHTRCHSEGYCRCGLLVVIHEGYYTVFMLMFHDHLHKLIAVLRFISHRPGCTVEAYTCTVRLTWDNKTVVVVALQDTMCTEVY